MMDKNVRLPCYLQREVRKLKNSFPSKLNVLVFDTETDQGIPYLLTFYDGQKPTYPRVNKKTILNSFMKYLLEHCSSHRRNILFAHNLPFDLTAVFCKSERNIFKWRHPPIQEIYDFDKKTLLGEITVYPQKIWFATIKLRNKAYIKVVDSTAFIKGKLKYLSEKLNLEHRKQDRPYFVNEGRKPRNKYEWKRLILYCGQEIKATYDLANYILNMHREFNVDLSVSAPHFASRVFRKYFMKEPIPQIPSHIRWLAEACIHGGRADTFVSTPITIPNVKMYDYNSFYPYAMTQLPNLTKGEWRKVESFVDEYEGFYLVNAFVRKCKYPIVIRDKASLRYVSNTKIRETPICSYELREALRNNEIDIEKIEGYVWIPSEKAENPFKDYAEHFYGLKNETSKENPLYITYKLLLNSLYGKTCQTIRETDYQEEPDAIWREDLHKAVRNKILYRAGGLYLPHVASWITSFCRAKLHEDLHNYRALTCATDSFKTVINIPNQGQKLGELKIEVEGFLLQIRPKLYVIFNKELQKEIEAHGNLRQYLKTVEINDLTTPKSLEETNPDIVRCATHGFWSNVHELLKLYRDSTNRYEIKHMVKIREAIRQKKQPRVMETQKRTIHVSWQKEKGYCGIFKGNAIYQKEMCALNCGQCSYFNWS